MGGSMKKLYGVITAMTTPFTQDNKVDVAALEEQTEFLIQKGIHCLYPCGTTGEMFSMSAEERFRHYQLLISLLLHTYGIYCRR